MNQVRFNLLLQAIKSNNLVLFSSYIKGNENLSFGRFPILSLCYLYNANKIIKAFQAKLSKMTKYKVVDENFEIYKKFRTIAGRCLRIYSQENCTISPLEMLAILHRESFLKKNYNLFEKNDAIINNLKTIFSIFGQNVEIDEHKIKIYKVKLNNKEKRKFKIAFYLSIAFVVIITSLYATLGFTLGFGTKIKAFNIYNETQLIKALNSNGNYVLNNDLEIDGLSSNLNFFGKLNGKNHTIYVDKLPNGSLLSENNGKIENLNIIYANLEEEISNSLSLFVGKNNGEIKKVNISCNSLKLTCNKSKESEIFVNSFAILNHGKIINCNLNLNTKIIGNLDGECLVSGFVGKNYRTIENCVFNNNSSIETSEVDVAGIASVNEKNAKIKNCKNYATISQASSINGWSPNVGGITLTNYGEVNNSHNYSNLTVISNNENENVEGSVFLGGISTMNYGSVKKCLNKGNLTALSKKLIVYCGGITAYSIYYIENEVTKMPAIINCGANSEINISTESDNAYVFAGGISGYLYGEVRDCYSLSTFTNGFEQTKYFIGNCIGSAYLQYQIFQSIICIDASGNFMLKQDNASYHIGSLINNGNIIAVGVNTSNGEITNLSAEQIINKEIYFDE